MIGIGIIIYTLILLLASCYYLKKRYCLGEKECVKEVVLNNKKFVLLTMIVFIAIISFEIYCSLGQDIYWLPIMMRWSTIFWGTYLLAKVDYHEKKIPNVIILALIVIRIPFLVYELIISSEIWKSVLLYPVFGAAIGAGVILIAMILSRSGIGMGDVKMLLVIGLYVGSTEIIDTMFFMFFASAIGGVFLLATSKAKMKDSIPMAPFAFIGVAMKYVLLMIGG